MDPEYRKKNPLLSSGFKRWLPVICIAFFLLTSLLADLRPLKNVYFYAYSRVDGLLTMDMQVNLAMRYAAGNGIHSTESLPYVLAVKLFHEFSPSRFTCLRLVSVCSTVAALYFLYRLVASIVSPPVSLLTLFLLVTSPIYLESMRAIGFIPLSNMVMIAAAYFFIAGLKTDRWIIKISVSVFFSLLTLSLYIPAKMIILIIVIFSLLFMKRYWLKAAVYLGMIIASILIIDRVAGDVKFDPEYALKADGEFLMYDPPLSRMKERLGNNVVLAGRYLFQIGRRPFNEPSTYVLEDTESRLFNYIYTPFFFLGLGICLWRRKKGHIFLLICFFSFFFAPIFSTELSPRRFVLALNWMYILIAIGLWSAYRYISAKFRSISGKKKFACLALIGLIGIGLYDLQEFFFQVIQPDYNYDQSQLEEIVSLIQDEGESARAIVIDEVKMRNLLWGNPFLNKENIQPEIIGKIHYWNRLQNYDTDLPSGEGGVLYLYPFPADREDFSGRERQLLSDLQTAEKNLQNIARVSKAAGNRFYSVLVKEGVQLPANQVMRLTRKQSPENTVNIPLRVSSEYSTVAGGERLQDGKPITYWKISHTELGCPAWIIRDFGPKGKKTVTSLEVLPREGHPEEFFREAELLGSQNGRKWELITEINQENVPPSGRWQKWTFENWQSYRYYNLIIQSGHSGRKGNFLSLAEFRLR